MPCTRFATKTDSFHKLDLTDFKRDQFTSGHTGIITWSRCGNKTGRIGFHLCNDWLRLNYSVTLEGERQQISETFPFTFTEQPFGGQRRWLVCLSCRSRCRVLYGGAYFRCRQCHGAVYESQYDPFPQLPWSRCNQVRNRLGSHSGLGYDFPPRPKGMHWKTYYRLHKADWEAETAMSALLTGHKG